MASKPQGCHDTMIVMATAPPVVVADMEVEAVMEGEVVMEGEGATEVVAMEAEEVVVAGVLVQIFDQLIGTRLVWHLSKKTSMWSVLL